MTGECKVFYLCDGNVAECGANRCCISGMSDMCRHTGNIEHAKNFHRIGTGKYESFWEKDDVREKIAELNAIKEQLQKTILLERKFIKKARWQQAKRKKKIKKMAVLMLAAGIWTSTPVHAEACAEMPQVDIEEELYYDSLELLAICVEAEATDQGLDGKRMVADVILNRVDDPDWPDDITGVISQPYQFTSFWDGSMTVAEPTEETFDAVRMELQERSWPGIYYFASGDYSAYGTPWQQVGDHYFSTK